MVNHSQNKTKLVVSAGKTECVRNETIGLDFVSSPMFALIGYSMLRIFLESIKGGETRGAFHSMKTSGLNFRRLTEKTTTLHGARYTKNFREFWLKGKRPRANISFSQWKTQLVSGAFSFTWKRGPWERGLIQRLVNMYIMQR